MADIITAEERTEWEWLFESATAGPWTAKRRWSNECEVVPRITCTPDSDRGCGWIADLIGAPYLGHESTLPNADFIAASRLGWPRTLAALEAAEAENASMKREILAAGKNPAGFDWSVLGRLDRLEDAEREISDMIAFIKRKGLFDEFEGGASAD